MKNETTNFISTDLLAVIPGGILLAGVIMDLRTRKVSNRFVVSAFAFSMIMAVLSENLSGLWTALGSVMAAAIIALPIYMLRAIGGGDFKLILAVSPLMTWDSVVLMIASSLIWGSVLGIFSAITHGQIKNVFQNMLGIFSRAKPSTEQLHRIPYTVAIFFGWITQWILQISGVQIL